MKLSLKIYLVIIFCFFIITAAVFGYQYFFDISIVNLLFFTLSLLLISNISMLFNSMSEVITSMNLPVLIPAFAILNPFWVGIVAFFGTIEFKRRSSGLTWYQFLFNRAVFFIAAVFGGWTFQLSSSFYVEKYEFFAMFAAALIYFIINNILVFIVLRISGSETTKSSLFVYFFELSKNLITSYFIGIILYSAYVYFGKVFFLLTIILLYILKDFFYSRLQQLNAYTQIIESFLKVIDSKDHYTEGHCKRVAFYTYHLSREMGLSRGKCEKIVNIAKIHDIGKISVDDEILKSSEKLTRAEYVKMKKHSHYGYELLKDIDMINDDLEIILYHHERYDGNGYPEGLISDEIPIGARILSVCDAFDVMTTGRSYKRAMNKIEVIEELKDCSGTQFDPEVVKHMIKLIDGGFFDSSFDRNYSDVEQNSYELSYKY
ncbi:MAG: HD-GYP domain-containing protein [Bacillota bacterium]